MRISDWSSDVCSSDLPVVEVPRGAVVRRVGDVAPENAAERGGGRALQVAGVGADDADMREGEGDDLAGLGRVGQDLLVAAPRGVEADIADTRARCAQAPPPEHRALSQDTGGGGARAARDGGGRRWK